MISLRHEPPRPDPVVSLKRRGSIIQTVASRFESFWYFLIAKKKAMRESGGVVKADEGYRLGYDLAAENLVIGLDVVADSCNPIQVTRRAWMDVAARSNSSHVKIEVVCSDTNVHRLRVERRSSDLPGLVLPIWNEVQSREYHEWKIERLVVDTASGSPEENLETLLELLK